MLKYYISIFDFSEWEKETKLFMFLTKKISLIQEDY